MSTALSLATRFARRELRGGLQGFRIFLACLALGVAAIAAVGTVREAIQAGLDEQGAAILGGDAEVEFTYRFAREDERAWMASVSDVLSETVDFRSMAVVGEGESTQRGLTQIRAVDSAYPLVGNVELVPPMPLADALSGNGALPGAVTERVLADRLSLAPGDVLRLGTQDFVLSAILERYPDNGSAGFALGPRTIVLTTDLAASGLLAEGTLFSTQYRLDLPPGADLAAVEAEADALFRDRGLRWSDTRTGADGISEFVDQLGAFLILIGLSGLAVGGVGVAAAVRAYLQGKTHAIATLKTLGATRRVIFLTYFLQIAALTVVGIAIGVILGGTLPLLLAPVLADALPLPANFGLYPLPLAEAALYGALAALLFTIWPLARTEEVRAATLFRDALGRSRWLPRWPWLVVVLVLLALLIGTAALLTGNAWLTLWTAAGIGGALLILVTAAALARILARWGKHAARGRPALRLALGAVGARGGDTTSVVLSLGLGLAVLAAVGQIDGNMRRAIAQDLPEVAPSYFFVDIQPDQIDGYLARLDSDPAVSRVDTAPMLRGVITAVNGVPALDVSDHWVFQSDRGITYSEALPDDTVLTAGEWWAPGYSGPPFVSFSEEEALEIGLELGDVLTINVLGRDLTATISSFRQVNFETAGIGFVMSLNPAALAGAPHSWISTVYAEEAAEAAILKDLADAYPNITAIRIRDAVDRVSELLESIASAVRYGAAATLLTGLLVLIGAAAAGEPARVFESAVLKTLGATRARILTSFALRTAIVGAAAGLVAVVAGLLGGWAVSRYVLETEFTVIWSNAFTIVGGGALATLITGLVFALRPLAARPARILRARE